MRVWHKAVLSCLRKGANVEDACRSAGIDSDTYYKWRAKHPEFRAEVDKAFDEAINALEAAAIARAKKFSDKLCEFILTRRHPRYKVNAVEGGSQPINVQITQECNPEHPA